MPPPNSEVLILDSDSDSAEDRFLLDNYVKPKAQSQRKKHPCHIVDLTANAPAPSSPKRQRTRPTPAVPEKSLAAARREAERDVRRKERIRRAFEEHEGSETCRRDQVELLVSPELDADVANEDFLRTARVLFPKQIIVQDFGIPNMMSWRQKVDANGNVVGTKDGPDNVNVSLLLFSAEHFMNCIEGEQLDKCARMVLEKRKGHQIIFAICNIEREIRKRARAGTTPGADDVLYGGRAVQDCYTHLYMEYGIRTRDCGTLNELAQYICDMTDAIASAPYRRSAEFLEATAKYRDLRRTLSNRTAVLSLRSSLQERSGCESDEDSDEGDKSGTEFMVRSEGSDDLGFMYLATLALIPGISINKARAIRERYPTLGRLFQAYKMCSSDDERDRLLANIRFGQSNRRLGPSSSKTVALVFTSMDPDAIVK